MEGLWFEKFGHKNAINHEKGDPLDFLITPSTPLKRIRPPGRFPSTEHLWCQWILISVEYARCVDSRLRGPAAKPPQLSRAKRICSTSFGGRSIETETSLCDSCNQGRTRGIVSWCWHGTRCMCEDQRRCRRVDWTAPWRLNLVFLVEADDRWRMS